MSDFFRTYRLVLSYLRPNFPQLFLFVGCSLVATLASMSIPKVIQFFIDVILPAHDWKMFAILLGGIAVAVILMLVANALQNFLKRILQERAAQRLQYDVFAHLRTLGLGYAERQANGETLSIFHTDVAAVQQIYRQYLPNIVSQLIMLGVLFGFLCSVRPQLTLLIVPCFLFYLLVGPYFEKKAAAYGKQAVVKRTKYNKKVYDSLSGILELRAYHATRWDFDRTLQSLTELNSTVNRQVLFTYSKSVVRGFSMYMSLFLIVVVCAMLVRNGQMTVGSFVSYTIYFFSFMNTILSLFTLLAEQRLLLFHVARLQAVIEQQPEVVEAESPIELQDVRGEIVFREVRFSYTQERAILNGLNLRIAAGDRVVLVGRSGSGKSTLLKLIGRFYDANQGDILFDGVPLRQMSLAQVRESIGIVFQETYLFGMSIRENIRFGRPDASDAEVEAAARMARLHDFIVSLPSGYETEVGEKGMKLSGGQKQRIAIARLFLKNPRIVIMDEATSALDTIHEAEVQEAMENLFAGRTSVIVTHRYRSIQPHDRVVVLEGGKVVESGLYGELLGRPSFLQSLAKGGEDVDGQPELGVAPHVQG